MVSYDIEVVHTQATPFARVGRRGRLNQIGELAMPALDVVWPAVRAAGLETGHNLIVYREASGDEFEMEIGVQVAAGSSLPSGEVVIRETPSGRAAHALHRGPYDQLPVVYDAIRAWAPSHDAVLSGTAWEVYGDWSEDASNLETDVYILLA
jgi:AraC family transcriptional regulator